ncbi:MAG: Smr/MutS family protein, partial [Breznakibacter sp.]|nr:Smr/MutS family protein [Breznakibacter sp.]
RNLLPAECLTIQLDTVRKTMRDHLKERGKRIVFIHGVGNGRLKSEVLRVLSREFPKCETQDASFQEYGFGATRVVIR